MHDRTPKGTIDEVYTDSRERMAIGVDSVMFGLLSTIAEVSFCGPHTMTIFL
jgi:hypothetical protein